MFFASRDVIGRFVIQKFNILQARCDSALCCSNMWKTNYPHRHVNSIALHVFVAATVKLQIFDTNEPDFSPLKQGSKTGSTKFALFGESNLINFSRGIEFKLTLIWSTAEWLLYDCQLQNVMRISIRSHRFRHIGCVGFKTELVAECAIVGSWSSPLLTKLSAVGVVGIGSELWSEIETGSGRCLRL